MIYSKNYRWGIGIQKFGSTAHTICEVYKRGIRCFASTDLGLYHITLVGRTHRLMMMFPYKKEMADRCA